MAVRKWRCYSGSPDLFTPTQTHSLRRVAAVTRLDTSPAAPARMACCHACIGAYHDRPRASSPRRMDRPATRLPCQHPAESAPGWHSPQAPAPPRDPWHCTPSQRPRLGRSGIRKCGPPAVRRPGPPRPPQDADRAKALLGAGLSLAQWPHRHSSHIRSRCTNSISPDRTCSSNCIGR